MADMQAGIGPFLGVYLLAKGWQSGHIGTVMTIGGVAGMIATAPAGALIDRSTRKRWYVVGPGICTVIASAIVLLSHRFWSVALSQIATAIAGAAIGPAVIGLTLGLTRQAGFPKQNARNQALNHAGNTVGAALSGWLGWRFGLPSVLVLAAVFGAISILAVMLIPAQAIDDRAARGFEDREDSAASGFGVLLGNRALVILAICLFAFHLGNAAMLPLYGMAVVSNAHGDGALVVAATIVVAQAVMVVASIASVRGVERPGYWWLLLISFLALPVRGLVAARFTSAWGVIPVQVLDGIGAGLQSVAVPGLVAKLLRGTGRVNVGQGAVMTAQGVGAALSPGLGGWIAELFGYDHAFLVLGAIATISVCLWLAVRARVAESLA